MAQDGFIDLYEVLNVPRDSDIDVLRARISQSYLEAQKNLDHRNAAKRLQYQQLYEVVLPQARHLLLDAPRREEYDRYLAAYRSGRLVEAAPQQTDAKQAGTSQNSGAPVLDVPDMTPPDVDPAKLAAEREAMWDKWKSGLETPTDPDTFALPPRAPQTSGTQAAPTQAASMQVAVAASTQTGAQAMPQHVASQNTAPQSATRQNAGAPSIAPQSVAGRSWGNAPQVQSGAPPIGQENGQRSAEEMERARENQRIEIVRVQEQTASIVWGFASATVAFLLVFAILLWLESYFHSNDNYPIGLSRGTFITISFVLTLVLAGVAGWQGAQAGRRRTADELSGLSYEQLVKRTGR